MIKKYLKKLMALGIIVTSVLALNPIGASAEWRQDSNGWWYADGSTWYMGWKLINGNWYYFDTNGYMKTGWIADFKFNSGGNYEITDVTYYYLSSNGSVDNSKTTKTLPSEIKKAYDILANFESDYSKNLYFDEIENTKNSNYYDNLNKFGLSGDVAYRFEINIGGDTCDELDYYTTSGKVLILNQGSYIIFDSKEVYDSISNKAKAINKIREWQRKQPNSYATFLNVTEDKNTYKIDKYIHESNNNGSHFDSTYSYNKENGEIAEN